jgi:exonuclease III
MLCVNVNGLSNRPKRRHFFLQLMQGSWDVVMLVETHCPSQQVADEWLQEGAGPGQPWRGRSFWCMGTSSSCGVAVLFSPDFAGSDLALTARDEGGRLLRVSWLAAPGRRCACLAVYAPVEAAARRTFLGADGPLQHMLASGQQGREWVFLAGDFNCALHADDVLGAEGSRAVGAAALADLLASGGLSDAWGSLHSGKWSLANDAYTRLAPVAGGGVTGARLDYIMVPAVLLERGWVQGCSHRWDVAPSDHAAVEVCLRPPRCHSSAQLCI